MEDSKATAKNKKTKHKSEAFYQKKRGLQRKADQLKRSCGCQVFLAVYKDDLQKIYTYSTSNDFDLHTVTEHILAEVNSGAFLKKNSKFEQVDFKAVRSKVQSIEEKYGNAHRMWGQDEGGEAYDSDAFSDDENGTSPLIET